MWVLGVSLVLRRKVLTTTCENDKCFPGRRLQVCRLQSGLYIFLQHSKDTGRSEGTCPASIDSEFNFGFGTWCSNALEA